MAATTLTAVTVIGGGVAVNQAVVVTAGTVTIAVTDMSRTFVRATNTSTGSVIISIGASDDPMVAEGIGAKSITLTSGQSQYFGASWDSARFKNTAGNIIITLPTAGTVTFEVGYMTPY